MVLTTPRTGSALRPDHLGRSPRKLRIQLTDACNLRCVYCMKEDATFSSPNMLLRPDEFGRICRDLRALGLAEARITGGEPTIRPDFLECLEEIATAGWDRLGMTTNGTTLSRLAVEAATRGLDNVNVSLDSLDPAAFQRITRRNGLLHVLRGIDMARAAGLQVKINCVVMRGVNDHEAGLFARWSAREGIEVRFLEAMRVGPLAERGGDPLVPSAELRARLETEFGTPTPIAAAADATATSFLYSNGAKLGFVSSESEPFCGGCSRLRLSARGAIRSCLFRPEGVSIRHLRGDAFAMAVAGEARHKPESRITYTTETMNSIGG